jgi:hypothetical protein
LKEVIVHADHEVVMEVDDNSAMIVADPQGILGQQLRPNPLPLLNIIINELITH